jgi:hypothetical protein
MLAMNALLARWLCATALIALPSLALAQEWNHCAREGRVCDVDEDALVRFGVPGRYVFRQVHDKINCTVRDFGTDPAVGETKSCERSMNWRQDPAYQSWRQPGATGRTWRPCAKEGDWCDAPAGAEVRFGIDGQFATKRVNGGVRCEVAEFGDPAFNRGKVCEVADSGEWTHCANEGQYCSATGTVRYTANGRSLERKVKGGIACNNGSFGDPYPNVAKQCEVRTDGKNKNGSAGWQGADPAQLGWRACAREEGQCSFRGAGVVRYGVDGRYAYREAVNGLACRNEQFGFDPAPRQTKSCEVLQQKRR